MKITESKNTLQLTRYSGHIDGKQAMLKIGTLPMDTPAHPFDPNKPNLGGVSLEIWENLTIAEQRSLIEHLTNLRVARLEASIVTTSEELSRLIAAIQQNHVSTESLVLLRDSVEVARKALKKQCAPKAKAHGNPATSGAIPLALVA